MVKRKSISKSLRFEVFKRDAFTCQYCGKKAPDILLVIDHIQPVAKDGTNDILNLITSCGDCNSGKSDRLLSEKNIIDKQRKQLEDLQERKFQIEMMFEWKKSLLNQDDYIVKKIAKFWSENVPGFSLNEQGIQSLKKILQNFGFDEIMEAIKISVNKYLQYTNGKPTQASVKIAFDKIGGICRNRRMGQEKPHMEKLFYIRGILRNRLNNYDPIQIINLLEDAHDAGIGVDILERFAKKANYWTEWQNEMEDLISSYRK